MTNFKIQASQMVNVLKCQYGMNDGKILRLMSTIPRHEFIPKKYIKFAYRDQPVDIGFGQTISQPYTVAYMTQLLIGKISRREKVLEIGTGSGYQAAVLSKLFDKVFTEEIVPQLASRAKKTLKKLGIKNVKLKIGNGQWGWEEHAPYNGILVTAGIKGEIPRHLIEQLKMGGVLVAPIGEGEEKRMVRFLKLKNKYKMEKFGNFKFVPFVEEKN